MLYAKPYMTEKMLKFVNVNQQSPNKRAVDNRLDDFKEIYDQFINNKAKEIIKEKPPLSFEQQLAQNLQGVGQREFKKRDTATLEALKSSGYDTSGISRWDQSDFLRDLRIGHAFDTGKGTIMYKPNRGMMKVIQKKKEEA